MMLHAGWLGNQGSTPRGVHTTLFSTACKIALGPTMPLGSIFPKLQWPSMKLTIHIQPPSFAEVKNTTSIYHAASMHTGNPAKIIHRVYQQDLLYFKRMSLRLNYIHILKCAYIRSWTFTDIMTRWVLKNDSCRTFIDNQIQLKTRRNLLFQWF